MKYMLLMYWDQSIVPKSTPEEIKAAAQDWYALGDEMKAAGVLVSNNGLSPITNATSVRVRDGKTLITDGPFAETHEQLGGYYILDCKDLDEAIGWAAKIPSAKDGTIEVRPTWSGN
ncbi:MAG: YciI family protein [Aggregatilineales bacterium]